MPLVTGYKTGVYAIRNKVNGKVYVGSAAKSLADRWRQHRGALRKRKHYNLHLQNAWNRYKEINFEFVVLERCAPARCVEKEQKWIDHFRAAEQDHGYNRAPTAGSVLGATWKLKEETLKRMSTAAKERGIAEVTRQKSIEVRKGKPLTEEHRTKISAKMKGYVPTDEHRAKVSAALTGIKRSVETRIKISAAKKGVRYSNKPPKVKAKAGSEEHKEKMRAAWRRRKEKFGRSGFPNVEAATAKKMETRNRNGTQCRGEKHWSYGKPIRRRADGTYLPST